MLKLQKISKNTKIGLVIGTYGSPTIIHLFLKSAKKNFSDIPVLIHDDHSDHQRELMKFARYYNCEFQSNPRRLGHEPGDVSSYANGLIWAYKNKIDILVKMSRRFIPFHDWAKDLLQLAIRFQHITYTNDFKPKLNDWLQMQCIAFYVPTWVNEVDRIRSINPNDKSEQKMFYITKDIAEKKGLCHFQPWESFNVLLPKKVDYLWYKIAGDVRQKYIQKCKEYEIDKEDLSDCLSGLNI